MGDHDHKGETRARVDVLRGDPYGVAALADSLNFAFRYTSYIYGWAPEEKPTLREIGALIDDWDRLAFAGMDLDRFMSTAIQHTNAEGKIDLHIIVARVDLDSGKSFNPCPPRSLKQFDRVRGLHNYINGWARPDDPDRARLFQPGRAVHAAQVVVDEPYTQKEMYHTLEAMIDTGELTTGLQVRQQARQWGEVTAEGDNFISIKPPGAKRGRRLRGVQFKLEWTAAVEADRAARKKAIRSSGRGGTVDLKQADAERRRLNAEIAERTTYNHRRYPPRPAIDPVQVMAQLRAELAQQEQLKNDRNRVVVTAATERPSAAEMRGDQQLRAAAEHAIAAATEATGAFRKLEHNYRRTDTTVRRIAFGNHRTSEKFSKLADRCRNSVDRLESVGRRSALQQYLEQRDARAGGTPTENRWSAATAGELVERIAELGRSIGRAAEALKEVSLSLAEPELDENAKIDAALKAAIIKSNEQQLLVEPSPLRRPATASVDFDSGDVDFDNDPLVCCVSQSEPALDSDPEVDEDDVLSSAVPKLDESAKIDAALKAAIIKSNEQQLLVEPSPLRRPATASVDFDSGDVDFDNDPLVCCVSQSEPALDSDPEVDEDDVLSSAVPKLDENAKIDAALKAAIIKSNEQQLLVEPSPLRRPATASVDFDSGDVDFDNDPLVCCVSQSEPALDSDPEVDEDDVLSSAVPELDENAKIDAALKAAIIKSNEQQLLVEPSPLRRPATASVDFDSGDVDFDNDPLVCSVTQSEPALDSDPEVDEDDLFAAASSKVAAKQHLQHESEVSDQQAGQVDSDDHLLGQLGQRVKPSGPKQG
ncbi:hypothetical protein [Marinobacterium georgiense]|uniref:hypothetical protein n=1 Tax=Marinobacterium iners TaxID=48076 RepID=UPI001A8FDCAA